MTMMPFGKHKGERLTDLPDDYLQWLVLEAEIKSAALASALRVEWLRRCDARERSERERIERERLRRGPQPEPRIVEDLIARGQRSLAKAAHPDTGGSHDAMLAVRQAADWLFAQAAALRELRG